MYLVLRRRLDEVKQWIPLGTDVMKTARGSRSYETIARLIPVSSKTYERYEKRGAVPREMVDPVARVLGLVIERPEFVPVKLRLTEEQREAVDDRLDAIQDLVLEIRDLVRPEVTPIESDAEMSR